MVREVSTRQVALLNDDGSINLVFSSFKEAAKLMEISPCRITEVCNGKIHTHKGYKFKWYFEDLPNETWGIHPTLKIKVSTKGRVQPSKGELGAMLKGGHTNGGYRKVSVNKKQYLVHRLVMETFSEELPKATVDHIDGDKTNNEFVNLRWATMKEQAQNRKTPKPFTHCVTCTCNCNPKE